MVHRYISLRFEDCNIFFSSLMFILLNGTRFIYFQVLFKKNFLSTVETTCQGQSLFCELNRYLYLSYFDNGQTSFLTNAGLLLVNTRIDFVTNSSTKRSCPYQIDNMDEAKCKCAIIV